MDPTLPSPAPGAEARPVDAGERLVLLDALRGFALCGVFVSNVYMWFSGRAFLPRAQMEAALKSASLPDTVANYAFNSLVFGRFITIFSFLFGLGFAVQLGRAEGRGGAIAPLYTRRLFVMLGLGLLHLFLIWYGDILSTYALLGFSLLLFYKRADRTLLAWAAVFIFVVPLLISVAMRLPQLLGTPGAAEAAKAAAEHSAAIKARTLEAFTHGSWFDVVRESAAYFFGDFLKPIIGFVPVLIGRFLLGLWAGRRRLFHDAPQHLPFFRRVLGWGLTVGILGTGANVLIQQLMLRKILVADSVPWLFLVMFPVRQLGELGLAAAYVSGLTLLFQGDAWKRRLSVLAPVGRMALTNYLSQSVIAVLIFYGYGLGFIGKVGPAVLLVLPPALFVLQVLFSHQWLKHFRFGPAEWVWRSLTYGKAQPMRREPGAADKELVRA